MSSAAPKTSAEYWHTYRPHRGKDLQPRPAAERFEWTGIAGHGPGSEFLDSPTTALDLGPAEGENAAFLARSGVHVTAVDFSLVQVNRARSFWPASPGWNSSTPKPAHSSVTTCASGDAIYSTWGAAWFTNPEDLFPLVAKCLQPGGVFAFSHREPITGQHGAQKMSGKWLEGREAELTVYRWQYTAQQWADILKRHGFIDIDARILPDPEPTALGTLLVRAWYA
ncbi:class I SAM-dependent methyltransferase (plasmid) [Streptomyces sp. NBC_00080]|uniref:class I SAM-dependent methyltransferase n=1 Tax=unclassified Streptomyces TaxID=2593676 RepID=UPI00114E2660|nr:methyltransferase domain-containing protein [Streptomyces sp. SLBN-115]TQJ37867.1 methyltransferase family protein [Streptomyces sp. SLBN-115]